MRMASDTSFGKYVYGQVDEVYVVATITLRSLQKRASYAA